MAEHGGGSIVNTTSIGGINAGRGLMAYRATKAAVIHLTRCDRDRPRRARRPRELRRARAHPDGDQHHLRPVADHPGDAAAAACRVAARCRGSRRSTWRATGPRRSPGSCCRSTAGRRPARRRRSIKDLHRRARRAPTTEVSDGSGDRRLLLRRPPGSVARCRPTVGVAARRAPTPSAARASSTRDGEPSWVCEDRVIGRSGHADERRESSRSFSAIGRAGIDDDGYRAGTPELRLAGHGPRRPARRR